MYPDLLLTAIELAETDPPHELKVTLIFDGLLISGFVTSENEYLAHLENAKYFEVPQEIEQDMLDPAFIHLRDAKFYQACENPNPQDVGSYFRAPLDAVIGFAFSNESN